MVNEIYGSDPEPLVEFPVKVSLKDLKIALDVWGEEAMENLVLDLCLRLKSNIVNAVKNLDFDTSGYKEVSHNVAFDIDGETE